MNAKDILLQHVWTVTCDRCQGLTVLDLRALRMVRDWNYKGAFCLCAGCGRTLVVYKKDEPGRHQG